MNLPDTRTWFRYRSKMTKRVKGNTRNNMNRHCEELHNKNMESDQPIAKNKTRKRAARGGRPIRVETVRYLRALDWTHRGNMGKPMIELAMA